MTPIARAKLAALLQHARETCPYWAHRLAHAEPSTALDPEAILRSLPPLEKQVLRRERARLLSGTGDTRKWQLARTTGTTGEAVEMILDEQARSAESAALARLLDSRVGGDWRAASVVHLVLHAGARSRVMRSPFHDAATAVKWNLLRLWQQPDDVFAERLGLLDAAVVTTFPSVLELLAFRVHTTRARAPRPLAIVLSGESVDTALVERAGGIFGCPVTAAYTLTEAGLAASACLESGYHVEEQAVHLEILDGDILVTPLDNHALPLLRYRTGDRGEWLGPCACGNPSPRLAIEGGRRAQRVVSAAGATLNVIRFSKLLAGLEVDRIHMDQAADGEIVFRYEATRALPEPERMLVSSIVRAAIGPAAPVRFERERARGGPEPGSSIAGVAAAQAVTAPVALQAAAAIEPELAGAQEIAVWLRRILGGMSGLHAAVITGSALDVAATTRNSDIDVVLLVEDPSEPRWLSLSRSVRRHVSRLTVGIDRPHGLSQRAPLLVCRLLCEQLPIVGRLDEALLPWPTPDDLTHAARVHLQDLAATLWQRLTAPQAAPDPLSDAIFATRSAIDALRYCQLLEGRRETSARAVLAAARPAPWLDVVRSAWDVARELVPPPPAEMAMTWTGAALECVGHVQRRVERV